MDREDILHQVKQEYSLWYEYVREKRVQFRERILKRGYQWKNKKADKININLIANTIDTLIASFWTDWIKTKFVSTDWFIGQEEAENQTNIYTFDTNEQQYQQHNYQIEQDSLFFGVWISNYVGWDDKKKAPKFRVINPLSWIPDPLPSRTGTFSAQNYRFHWFMMQTNIFDLKSKSWYNIGQIDSWIQSCFDSDETLTREKYADKNNLNISWTLYTLWNNFAMDIYHHYTILNGKKYLVVTDAKMWYIFKQEELKPVLVEEKDDTGNVPRPIMLNYYDPERDNPFGKSLCDKLEDKQNAKSILFNLNVMKAKKEALGGTFLVNSRLIKNKEELNKPTTDTKYVYLNENIAEETPISNAIYELPQSQIKVDSYNMISAIEKEAREDSSVDSLQQWLVPDKSMTKAEAQQIQANANMKLSLKNGIKSWFYKEFAFMRWRSYQENFNQWQKKFIALNQNFEWKAITYQRDDLYTRNQPFIIVWSINDIEAINEKKKQYMNATLPIIMQDPELPKVAKNFAKRITYKLNGLSDNEINVLCPMTPDERIAKEYVFMVNSELMPKSILSSNVDIFTVYLYLQKADDNKIKAKLMWVLQQMLIEQWMQQQIQANQNMNQIANASANIQMSQNSKWWQEVLSRDLQPNK